MLIQNIIGAAVSFFQNIFALQISLFLGHVGDITKHVCHEIKIHCISGLCRCSGGAAIKL